MNPKIEWKRLSYIEKGGIIGALIGLLYTILFLIIVKFKLSFFDPTIFFVLFIPFIFLDFFIIYMCGWEGQGGTFPEFCKGHYDRFIIPIIAIIAYTLIGILLGMFMGYIIQKVKKK